MPSSLINDQLNTAALVALIAQENDPTERQRLRIQLGFTDIVDKLLQRAEKYENDTDAKFLLQDRRLDLLEPVVEENRTTIISWKATFRILTALFILFQSVLGVVVFEAWHITTTMYKEVKELTVTLPKLKTLSEEAKIQTKVLTETKKSVEDSKANIAEQLDNTRVNDERIDELNAEINRIKKLKAVRGSK
jgi:lysyl-tRNA synthetase class I